MKEKTPIQVFRDAFRKILNITCLQNTPSQLFLLYGKYFINKIVRKKHGNSCYIERNNFYKPCNPTDDLSAIENYFSASVI